MTKVMAPTGKDAVSVRRVHRTTEERKSDFEQFKEKQAEKERIKDERFAQFRKQRNGGRDINIKVDKS